jgi:hypothetical protein
MPLSTCCGAETDFTEIDICPECLEHCDFQDEEEETPQDELKQDRQTEHLLEQQQINKHEN